MDGSHPLLKCKRRFYFGVLVVDGIPPPPGHNISSPLSPSSIFNFNMVVLKPCKHAHARSCRTCKSWVAKAKANGQSCRTLYWALQKIMENMTLIVNVPVGVTIHEAKRILDSLRGTPSDASDIQGSCVVCYENYDNIEHKPIAFGCGHLSCLSCVAMDLKKCPKCSGEIKSIIPLFV